MSTRSTTTQPNSSTGGTSEASNRLMMEEFDRLAWQNFKELALGQKVGPGKSVVFAITKHHAARLAQYLNELHPEHKGALRRSHYLRCCQRRRSDSPLQAGRAAMVAVESVGMLDTRFGLREVLHLVMCRRIQPHPVSADARSRYAYRSRISAKSSSSAIFRNHESFSDSDTDIFSGSSGGGYAPKPRLPVARRLIELIELGLEG